MKSSKKKKLENKGWCVGSASEFLGLNDEEATYIDLKLSLSRALKKQRLKKRLSQIQLAKAMNSSQSRVAKMEAGDPSVSLDLLVKSLLVLGTSRRELAKTISTTHKAV